MDKNKTNRHLRIRDMETLRAVSAPLRVHILELLLGEELTVKSAAEKLGLASSKLYYHFAALEKLGAIEVARTRMVANMEEKTYRAAVEMIDVDPSLFKFSKEGGNESFDMAIASTIDATREDIMRSLQARQFQLEQGAEEKPRRFIINRIVSRVSEKRVKEYQERLVKLMREFEEEDNASKKSTDQPYALSVALYPSFYFEQPAKTSKKGKTK